MTAHAADASVADGLNFYPAYCHSLSPTANVWANFSVADVHRLTSRAGFAGQSIYFHLNHPIKWVRLVGVLVALEEFDRRWIMVLDDSSGQTIDVVCTKPAPRPPTEGHIIREGDVAQSKNKATATISKPRDIDLPDMTGIDLGSVVKIKGGIGEYRGVKQINLKRIHVVPSTAHEVKAWAELATFRADVLSRPWVVSERKQRKLAQRLKGEGKAKKRRKDGDSRGSRIECKEKETRDAVEAEARKAGKGPSTRIRHDADTTGRGDTDETTSNHAAIRNEEPDVIDVGVHRREAVDESITRHIPSEPHQDTSSMFDKNRYRYPARSTSITTHRAQRLPTQRVSGNLRKEPEELQHEDRRDVTPTLDTVHERARVKVDMSKYDALGLG